MCLVASLSACFTAYQTAIPAVCLVASLSACLNAYQIVSLVVFDCVPDRVFDFVLMMLHMIISGDHIV